MHQNRVDVESADLLAFFASPMSSRFLTRFDLICGSSRWSGREEVGTSGARAIRVRLPSLSLANRNRQPQAVRYECTMKLEADSRRSEANARRCCAGPRKSLRRMAAPPIEPWTQFVDVGALSRRCVSNAYGEVVALIIGQWRCSGRCSSTFRQAFTRRTRCQPLLVYGDDEPRQKPSRQLNATTQGEETRDRSQQQRVRNA